MENIKTVNQTLSEYGYCLSLISMDPNFHNMSVSLYIKNKIFTITTFCREKGYKKRIEEISNQLVLLAGMNKINNEQNQLTFPDELIPSSALKFAFKLAVEKPSDFKLSEGNIKVQDTKSPLTIIANPLEDGNNWKYEITAEGEAKNSTMRIRAIILGLTKFANMQKIDHSSCRFESGKRHDKIVRLILPYARNISAVSDSLEADAMRGQLTTETLGFSQI